MYQVLCTEQTVYYLVNYFDMQQFKGGPNYLRYAVLDYP